MTELNLNFRSVPVSTAAAEQNATWRRWKRGTIALFLSLLFPGMGQLYNRSPLRGVLMAISFPVSLLLAGPAHVFLHFWSMVSYFIGILLWRLIVAVDAAYIAQQESSSRAPVSQPKFLLVVSAAIILLAALLPTENQFFHIFPYFRAYKTPSASMCPTICKGERFVADATAYAKSGPARGDVILLRYESSQPLYMKRVVGVGGDLVAPGPRNSLVVNGNQVTWPDVCGESWPQQDAGSAPSVFAPIRVPENALFVVGDNLNNSFDSRIEGFGPVTKDQVRGRPLYIYWSPLASRIGCAIH